jgi:transglutaminase-like putative cysteine protease
MLARIFNRRTLAFAVLGLWIAVVGWHVRREYFKPVAMRLAEGARSLAPGVNFYAVKMNGQSIGYAQTRLDTVPDGFVFSDFVLLDVPALNQFHRAVAQTRIELGHSLQLERFDFQLDSEIGKFKASGEVAADSTLELEVNAGGKEQRTRMKMHPDLLLDAAVPIRLAAGGNLQVGKTFRTLVFNPSAMSEQEVDMRVTARDTIIVPDSSRWNGADRNWEVSSFDTIPVWRVEQTFGGITVASWVDEDGHLVRAESEVGYTLERTTYEIAEQEWKRARNGGELIYGYGPVIERTAIASNADLSRIAQTPVLRVKLKNVKLAGFDLSGGRQQLHGDTLVIQREVPQTMVANYQLPYRGGGEQADALKTEPLVQADDENIVRTAREIAGGSTDPAVVSRRLNDWVYSKLKKDVTLSVPSAVQVLEARQGDCNEHTVLYLALARALGLPARSAAGLVHVKGQFYYHAWPEVWLGTQWVALDPTLGQYPADASHLRFIIGGLARQVELIRLIGKLQLEVL